MSKATERSLVDGLARRVVLVGPLLDLALGHVLDSPTCAASLGVDCASCGTVLCVPWSGAIPPGTPNCRECAALANAARAWRRDRLEVAP